MLAFDWLPGGADNVWLVPAAGFAAFGALTILGWLMVPPAPPAATNGTAPLLEMLKSVNRERRAAARRKGNTVEVHVRAGDAAPVPGWIIDRSAGGVCVLVDAPLHIGTPLRLRAKKASEHVPWTDAVVKSCRPDGTQHELGCEFYRKPDWNLLLQFG